jgi:hypothetical protein
MYTVMSKPNVLTFQSLNVTQSLSFKNFTWQLHCIYVLCVDTRTNITNRLIFINEVESVYSAVRKDTLYKTDTFGI